MRETEDAIILQFMRSDLVDSQYIEGVRQELRQLIDSVKQPRIVMSLEGVQFISSSAVGVIAMLCAGVREKGGSFALACIGGPVQDVLRLVRMDHLFATYDSIDAALASLAAE